MKQASVLDRITDEVCRNNPSMVVEIGPGRGSLTRRLLGRGLRVVAIEVDASLVERLRESFSGERRLDVVHQDVLRADLSQWGRAAVAGNLPYYITSPILARIFRYRASLAEATLLVQKEVAERIVAQPGSRDFGYLTVQTQVYAEPEMLFTVPPRAFQPPPKVDSALVRLRLRGDAGDEEPFLEFAARSFRQKRKTLRNNLAPVYGRATLDGLPEAGLRAEQLSVAQLRDLYARLASSPPAL